MALTQAQRAMLERALAAGAGPQGIALSSDDVLFLVGVIASDLGLANRFPEFTTRVPEFFEVSPFTPPQLPRASYLALFERLVQLDPNADTYFACLAKLHKSRVKYERILETQPLPTVDQIGPRILLQHGRNTPPALAGFLFWRKWIYDIDNRAAQETGYLFEPIIASSIGGAPFHSTRSPIHRKDEPSHGRQVDCAFVSLKRAYEIKLRVTIAASGQGRWKEELDFPQDCEASGYTPVLVVLDPTPNPKLATLVRAFRDANGEVYIGQDAWEHFEQLSGSTMARFLEKYVRDPIQTLLASAPEELPDLRLEMSGLEFRASIAGDTLRIPRHSSGALDTDEDPLPLDVEEDTPGP